MFPSSGSGALESVVVNLFSEGDTIVASSIGVFSERFATIAKNFGLNVIRIDKEWREAVKPEDVRKILEEDKENKIKAVEVPQNETTTGVVSDIEGIARVIKELGHPALLIVDGVSSVGCIPMETDLWGVDVVVSASQKGFMLPPGMGFVILNDRAWEYVEKSTLPKWYWDYKAVREKLQTFQFPYTPATTLLYGMKEAIDMLMEEGLENVWKRHALNAEAVRNAIKAMGLTLLTNDEDASDTVTAIKMPENIKYKELSNILNTKYGVVIGGGLGKLQGQIFRIGHLGSLHTADVYAIMGCVEMALYELGYNVELGTAAKAVAKTFLG
jgi:aspartate aminotransferase-like enzyme